MIGARRPAAPPPPTWALKIHEKAIRSWSGPGRAGKSTGGRGIFMRTQLNKLNTFRLRLRVRPGRRLVGNPYLPIPYACHPLDRSFVFYAAR